VNAGAGKAGVENLEKGISAHHHRELETPEPRRFAHCIMRRLRTAKLSKRR
jgi:hypothetical protein